MTNVRVGAIRVGVVLGLLLVAVLFAAHTDTWSMVVAFAVGIAAFVVLRRIGAGRSDGARNAAAFVVCLVVLVGATAVVRAGWIDAVGRRASTTVTAVDSYCTGRHTCDRREGYTLRLADGGTVPGQIRGFRPGSYDVGETVTVRYDPFGLVRDPVTVLHAARTDRTRELGGAVLAVVGVALLVASVAVGLRRRPPHPPHPRPVTDPRISARTCSPGPGRSAGTSGWRGPVRSSTAAA